MDTLEREWRKIIGTPVPHELDAPDWVAEDIQSISDEWCSVAEYPGGGISFGRGGITAIAYPLAARPYVDGPLGRKEMTVGDGSWVWTVRKYLRDARSVGGSQ